jgi:hypothetical protein
VEDQVIFALWFRFWPLLLVASGLPLLLVPRNDANQVFASSSPRWAPSSSSRTSASCRGGVRQTAAVVLILVGVVILLQSQRRGEESGTGSSGDAL